MPAAELLGAEDLLNAYAQAWREIQAEQIAIAGDPLRLARMRRLREMQNSIERILTQLDDETFTWLSTNLPEVYAAGASVGAQGAGGDFVWSQVHQGAVQNLVNRAYDDLLASTKYARRTTKELVRTLVKDEALQKTIQGRTAVDAGRRVTKLLESKGVAGITYRDGTRHGLKEYGQMVIRTVTAQAYNEGNLNAAHALGVEWWECFDGPECGWSFHEDPETANGKIVTRDEALAFPISHPNCRRSFGPRPDITSKEQAAEAGRSTTASQDEAIRASDAARGARVERRRAGRPSAADRQAEREAKLAEREAARGPKTYGGPIKKAIADYRADTEPSLMEVLGPNGQYAFGADKKIQTWLRDTNPNPLDTDIRRTVLKGASSKAAMKVDSSVDAAMDFYQDSFSKDAMAKYKQGRKASVIATEESKRRAFYRPRTREVCVGGGSIRTTVHEFGHHFENEIKTYSTKAKAFLKMRAGKEEASKIYSFSDTELGWKDDFINHYMGKRYLNWEGKVDQTEIISMGFEMMAAEPARLLAEDPEYFWFIVGLLRGSFASAA